MTGWFGSCRQHDQHESGRPGAKAVVGENFAGGGEAGWGDIEKRPDSFGAKDDAAKIRIRLDDVFGGRFRQQLFQAQGFFQPFGDVEEMEIIVVEIVSGASHREAA